MCLTIQEVRVRDMTTGAGTVAEACEGTAEDRLAASSGLWRGTGKPTIGCQHGVGQKVEFEHVGDQRVQHEGRRLLAAELVDDHVAAEIAQGSEAAIAAIGSGEAQSAQARNINRVVAPVVEDGIEECAIHVDRTGLVAGAGDEEALVHVRAVVTGRTADSDITRGTAEDLRAVEQHVAIGDEWEVRFIYALLLEVEHKQRQRVLIENIRAGRQAWRHFDGAATQHRCFR